MSQQEQKQDTVKKENIEGTGIMKYFPLPSVRPSQKIVLEEIDSVLKSGKKIIILEAPVGSGKSPIAITMAKSVGEVKEEGVGGAHIITPRKSLQDQYYDDFHKDVVLMKGRNSYPCTIDSTPRSYAIAIKAIKEGRIAQPGKDAPNCADAPCRDNSTVFDMCTENAACPYAVAIQVAQQNPAVIHNLHSFIFQSKFGGKFQKREMRIVDEAHEIENTIRGFISKKLILNKVFTRDKLSELKTQKDWGIFLSKPEFIPEESAEEKSKKIKDKTYKSFRDEYLEKVFYVEQNENFAKGFSVEVEPIFKPGTQAQVKTALEFVPHSIGQAAKNMLFDYGDKVLLMSGTIYSRDTFCRNLGINPSEAHFVRIGSSFPKENRPLYAKPQYQVNTSHATWNENFAEFIEITQKIMEIFKDAKGLIHAPSYVVAQQIRNALNDPRVMSHEPSDFLSKLEEFYARKEPLVFISPTCQQGVDFKDDRARFQIITRVPYSSTSSKFVEDKVKDDFPWYNYQALVVFGQQIGRINRNEGDYGATFLVDERFNKFISRNSKILPNWVKEAVVWK